MLVIGQSHFINVRLGHTKEELHQLSWNSDVLCVAESDKRRSHFTKAELFCTLAERVGGIECSRLNLSSKLAVC